MLKVDIRDIFCNFYLFLNGYVNSLKRNDSFAVRGIGSGNNTIKTDFHSGCRNWICARTVCLIW